MDNFRSEIKADANSCFVVVTEGEIVHMFTFRNCVVLSVCICLYNLGEQWLLEYLASNYLDLR